jgi:sterol 3beta-glucosyltransferase
VLGLQPLGRKFWPSQFDKLGVPLSYLVSPTVLAPPDDWASNINMIGYSFEAIPPNFQPPRSLLEFLSPSKDPIVYIDFSSNVITDLKRLTSAVLEAIRIAGVRAIIRQAWFEAELVPPAIFIVDDLPHMWLFPRIDLIVHSCGAGITSMALRSGKPSVRVPFRGDLYLWAKRLEQIGVAPTAIFAKDVDARN